MFWGMPCLALTSVWRFWAWRPARRSHLQLTWEGGGRQLKTQVVALHMGNRKGCASTILYDKAFYVSTNEIYSSEDVFYTTIRWALFKEHISGIEKGVQVICASLLFCLCSSVECSAGVKAQLFGNQFGLILLPARLCLSHTAAQHTHDWCFPKSAL